MRKRTSTTTIIPDSKQDRVQLKVYYDCRHSPESVARFEESRTSGRLGCEEVTIIDAYYGLSNKTNPPKNGLNITIKEKDSDKTIQTTIDDLVLIKEIKGKLDANDDKDLVAKLVLMRYVMIHLDATYFAGISIPGVKQPQ